MLDYPLLILPVNYNKPIHPVALLAKSAFGFALVALGCGSIAWGQTAVTGWTVTSTDSGNTNPYGTPRFDNTTFAVSGFSTASASYTISGTANAAYIRRNTNSSGNGGSNQSGIDNNNFTSTWVADDGSGRALGTYQSSLNSLLLNNNISQGSDNLFVNSNNTSTLNAGNIERVDFAWTSGVTASSNDGITLFDRGVAGAHDTVKIAVFTGWDSVNNRPTTYGGNVVTLVSANYGANNLDWDPTTAGTQSNIDNYYILRFSNGDNLTSLADSETATAQGIGGAFISFANLGIANNTTIYGYSIFAGDVTNTVANLADWTNATYYPTVTTDTSGGIDLVGFNGRISRPVPEPGTYGALLMGFSLAAISAYRWRRRSGSR
jgi:hypothetical protein